jgi:UDP-glucuronate 4-epimerase
MGAGSLPRTHQSSNSGSRSALPLLVGFTRIWRGKKVQFAPFPKAIVPIVKILVTGAAGFIGAHVCQELIRRGIPVVGVDNFNSYYDPALKRDRVAALIANQAPVVNLDVADKPALDQLFATEKFSHVVHLAAQAGVRHSLTAPYDYLHANLHGYLNILEACRAHPVAHLVYASTSSVYGGSTQLPYVESQKIDRPLSLYSATKGANELMGHAYAHLYGIAMTGLRFFTVYGPWGRPDMAPILFTRAIMRGEPIAIFNDGLMRRDFTYVSDIVAGVCAALFNAPNAAQSGAAAYALYNLGAANPVDLLPFIALIEKAVGKNAVRELKALQPGDMLETFADTSAAELALGYRPQVDVAQGVDRLVAWAKTYYR